MADAEHEDMDLSEHRKTYEMFLGLTKWTVIVVVSVLVLMAIFLY